MKGKHEWGNEGAGVVSDQITISTDYWRGKRLIELFYHTESLRLSPHTQKKTQYHYHAGWRVSHICGVKAVSALGRSALR